MAKLARNGAGKNRGRSNRCPIDLEEIRLSLAHEGARATTIVSLRPVIVARCVPGPGEMGRG